MNVNRHSKYSNNSYSKSVHSKKEENQKQISKELTWCEALNPFFTLGSFYKKVVDYKKGFPTSDPDAYQAKHLTEFREKVDLFKNELAKTEN